jgi:hypothetical protein
MRALSTIKAFFCTVRPIALSPHAICRFGSIWSISEYPEQRVQQRKFHQILTNQLIPRIHGLSSKGMLAAAAKEFRFVSLSVTQNRVKMRQIVAASDLTRLLDVVEALAPCLLQVFNMF